MEHIQGNEVYRADYVRDKLGRIVQKTETIQGGTAVWDYTYGPSGRLIQVDKDSVSFATYTYDANGNRLTYSGTFGSFSGTYDAQDRLTFYGGLTYTYTPAGELATKSDGVDTVSYTYDAFGALRTVALPTGITIDYVVDGQGRRVGKKVNGVLSQGFLYGDQLNPVAELDGTGAVVSRFVYGARANVPAYVETGGSTYRIVADHLGSVRLVVDTATGAVVQRLDYDEYGRVTLDTNPGFQPFGFAGGLYEAQTGLVRFGARDYDPEVGRWTAKDPIGFEGGDANLFGYVLGNPTNFIDPEGKIAPALALPFIAPGATAVIVEAGVLALGVAAVLWEWWNDELPDTWEPIPHVGPRDKAVPPGKGCPKPGRQPRVEPGPFPRPAPGNPPEIRVFRDWKNSPDQRIPYPYVPPLSGPDLFVVDEDDSGE